MQLVRPASTTRRALPARGTSFTTTPNRARDGASDPAFGGPPEGGNVLGRNGSVGSMADAHDLHERLQRLEDLQAIQQLSNDYGRHLDHGDVEAYAELFTEDAELLLGPIARATGRSAIVEAMRPVLSASKGSSVHLIGFPNVDLHGDAATSEVAWTVLVLDGDGSPRVSMYGHHRDDLVRQDGTWRIRRRRGYVDLPSAVPNRT